MIRGQTKGRKTFLGGGNDGKSLEPATRSISSGGCAGFFVSYNHKEVKYVKRSADRAWFGGFALAISRQVHDGRRTERHRGYGSGLLGDRAYALVDSSDGKAATAKNPRKWPRLFDFRANFIEPARATGKVPPVRIALPDGTTVTSDQDDLNQILSKAVNREVTLRAAQRGEVNAEEYWPDMEGLDHRDTVTDFTLPEGTFFDCATVHLLTTATLDRAPGTLSERALCGTAASSKHRRGASLGREQLYVNAWIGHMLAIGDDVRLSITGPCGRCVMTTLAQGELPKDSGILRTAVQHNRGNVGLYAAVVRGGTIRRGDRLTLTD